MDNTLYLFLLAYGSVFNGFPEYLASAPGRVNLIGEHTDYNEGFVLPMAIEQRTRVLAKKMYGDLIRVMSVKHSDKIEEFIIRDLIANKATKDGKWSDYVKGVANEFVGGGYPIDGFWALYHTDIPIGAGLSSSAALEVSTALLLSGLFGHDIKPEDLVKMSRSAEVNFVGVRCGVMDQMASLLAREGHAMFIDCRDLSYEHIPVKLADSSFVAINTMVKRELGSSVYNERRDECEKAAAAIKKIRGGVKTLRDATPEDIDKIKDGTDDRIVKRARHIITENARVLKAKDFLASGSLAPFGELMYESHASLKNDFEVSSTELDLIVDTAKKVPGVFGARMTGGGFGGCAIALVKNEAEETLVAAVKEAFSQNGLAEPEVYPVRPSGGATVSIFTEDMTR